jgi:hypothetical protein
MLAIPLDLLSRFDASPAQNEIKFRGHLTDRLAGFRDRTK